MRIQILLLYIAMTFSVIAMAGETGSELAAVNAVLNDFHAAAAEGDKARYLGLMTDEAVYLGTDEWERWPKHPEFSDYVDGRFKDGTGWAYKSVERVIAFSASGDIAWFDEVTVSERWGRFRGTGVLSSKQGEWRIEHYAMSFLVLNENWEEVTVLTKKTRGEKK